MWNDTKVIATDVYLRTTPFEERKKTTRKAVEDPSRESCILTSDFRPCLVAMTLTFDLKI